MTKLTPQKLGMEGQKEMEMHRTEVPYLIVLYGFAHVSAGRRNLGNFCSIYERRRKRKCNGFDSGRWLLSFLSTEKEHLSKNLKTHFSLKVLLLKYLVYIQKGNICAEFIVHQFWSSFLISSFSFLLTVVDILLQFEHTQINGRI